MSAISLAEGIPRNSLATVRMAVNLSAILCGLGVRTGLHSTTGDPETYRDAVWREVVLIPLGVLATALPWISDLDADDNR
jgi:hypothetical protein